MTDPERIRELEAEVLRLTRAQEAVDGWLEYVYDHIRNGRDLSADKVASLLGELQTRLRMTAPSEAASSPQGKS